MFFVFFGDNQTQLRRFLMTKGRPPFKLPLPPSFKRGVLMKAVVTATQFPYKSQAMDGEAGAGFLRRNKEVLGGRSRPVTWAKNLFPRWNTRNGKKFVFSWT